MMKTFGGFKMCYMAHCAMTDSGAVVGILLGRFKALIKLTLAFGANKRGPISLYSAFELHPVQIILSRHVVYFIYFCARIVSQKK